MLRHNLIHDLAALNKEELLLWDAWGLMEREEPTVAEMKLLDRVAIATASHTGEADFAEQRAIYEDEPGLGVPAVVTSYSPAVGGVPREVRLGA